MAAVIFLLACCLALAASARIGLPCMQPDTVKAQVRKCFSGLGESNLINLDPTDRSGTFGQIAKMLTQEGVCRHQHIQDEIVEGLGCYLDFYGDCFNMRQLMTTRSEIRDALKYVCLHTKEMQDPCLEDVPKDMMLCYLQKVKEIQVDIIMGKTRYNLKDETCMFLKEEMKCLQKGLITEHCSTQVATAYKTFMGKMMPHVCSFPDSHKALLDTLKHSSKLGKMLMQHTKLRGPR